MSDDAKKLENVEVAMLAGDLRMIIGKLKRRLRDETPPGEFTGSQMAVLARLERLGPATVTSLARAEGVRPQSMGATVSGLEAAGFVCGSPDPADGRQIVLSLTAACRDWLDAHRAVREDWLQRAVQTQMSSAERTALAIGVELLKRLVDRS